MARVTEPVSLAIVFGMALDCLILEPAGMVDSMNPKLKFALLILGLMAAILIVSQLVLGQLIASGGASVKLIKSHQHTGYLTVTIVLIYLVLSLSAIVATPSRSKG